METLRRSQPQHPSATLPLWTVWAVAPLVIALGIIGGMAVATYTDLGAGTRPAPAAAAAGKTPAAANGPAPSKPAGSGTASPSNSNANPPNTSVTGQMEMPSNIQTGPVPSAGTTIPGGTPTSSQSPGAPSEVKDLRDAKAALDESFSFFAQGGAVISPVQYQLMTNAGFSKSLVGMISVEDHEAWQRAVRENPQALKAWLEKAAARVRPALEKEQVFLAWAVVEVRRERPAGFNESEVKSLSDGSYLITKPLASTIDPSQTAVSLRPAASPGPGSTAASGPWGTYGPQIRFDSTDMYRPLGSDGKQLR